MSLEKISLHSVVGIAVTILLFTGSAFVFSFAPDQIPLWYSVAIPEQQLERSVWIFIFPALSFILTAIHTLLLSHKKLFTPELAAMLWMFSYIPLFLLVVAFIHIATAVL